MSSFIPRFLILFIFFSYPTLSFSQVSPSTSGNEISIQGTLVQESTKGPLGFATVVAYDRQDSTMITNTLTENNGDFRLELLPGNYYLVITYLGFEDKIIPDLNPESKQNPIQLGTVMMRADAVSLQEVEVRAERSQMEFKLDRRVFNVGKDLTNAGSSAADILDNVPSVSVDPEGNVSLRGSEGVRILE